MATLKDMVDEIRSNLAGYTLRQDRITYLANPTGISTTDTSIKVGTSNNFAKGIVEIDDELIWVDSFEKASSTLSVIPGFGRGYSNTTPAPHSQYSQVTLAPTFPRNSIKKAINDTITSVFPKLWSVSSFTFTYSPSQNTYAVPDDAETILAVTWQTVGPSQEWSPVKRWRTDSMASATSFNSNTTVTIYDPIQAGRTVQVWYTSQPNTLDSNTDDFADVSGLPDTSKDVIIFGACYRLLSFVDAGRINLTSAEADAADSKIPSNAAASSSKYLYALFQQRLAEESGKLQGKYPIKIHYTR